MFIVENNTRRIKCPVKKYNNYNKKTSSFSSYSATTKGFGSYYKESFIHTATDKIVLDHKDLFYKYLI